MGESVTVVATEGSMNPQPARLTRRTVKRPRRCVGFFKRSLCLREPLGRERLNISKPMLTYGIVGRNRDAVVGIYGRKPAAPTQRPLPREPSWRITHA